MQSRRRKVPAAPNEPNRSDVSEHLSNIDKLLSAAFDLMKQSPAIDKAAFEQIRQLRVRIRYALAASATRSADALPDVAPALFKDREDKNEDPIAFTKRIYSKWLGKNICRSDIKKLDAQLYNALYNLDSPGERLDRLGLPTKKQLNDVKLKTLSNVERPSTTLKIGELPPNQREHARLFNLARGRTQRSKL